MRLSPSLGSRGCWDLKITIPRRSPTYDPDKLQARIDVPLSEAAQLKPGQAALVRSNFLPDNVFRGVVTRITGEADLQRNTLQAKVAIESPDGRLRPEMLCRAEFLASVVGDRGEMNSTHAGSAKIRLYVPESALIGRSDSFAEVWILDESNERIRRQRVKLEDERREDYIRVETGFARAIESLPIRDRICELASASLSRRIRQVKDSLLMNTEIFIECKKASKSYRKRRTRLLHWKNWISNVQRGKLRP